MDTTLYPRRGNNWDDELFRTRLLEHIGAGTRCLDFGAGRGNVKQMNFKGLVGWVAGVDLERAVASRLDGPRRQHRLPRSRG